MKPHDRSDSSQSRTESESPRVALTPLCSSSSSSSSPSKPASSLSTSPTFGVFSFNSIRTHFPHRDNTNRGWKKPRYIINMTSVTARIIVFHVLCWLPFCIVQFIQFWQPTSNNQAAEQTQFSFWSFIVSTANWLTYAASATNWIFYFALNRDLRPVTSKYAFDNFIYAGK